MDLHSNFPALSENIIPEKKIIHMTSTPNRCIGQRENKGKVFLHKINSDINKTNTEEGMQIIVISLEMRVRFFEKGPCRKTIKIDLGVGTSGKNGVLYNLANRGSIPLPLPRKIQR